MDLLKFTTAGSVDDGKSTLIGRLLYDSRSIHQDQYEAIERASAGQGNGAINLALLTDGLRAEREQGITIDVAYRYFSTSQRKFIIADTPGHIQYTRNMVTGASTAELAIILIDARNGVLQQSRRHGFIASLLQIPHILVAINKMDLVGYSEETYREIVADYREFVERVDIDDVVFIPISALEGDNVVEQSDRMDWYRGPTILHHLETVKVGEGRNVVDFRFPVQYVIRPNQNFRGYAGRVVSGSIAPGEDIIVLPSGQESRVHSIVRMEDDSQRARAGDSVVITVEDDIDIGRGEMIVRRRNQPQITRSIDADICWMSEQPMKTNRRWILQHATRNVQAVVGNVIYRMNVDTLHRETADTFGLNDIGRIEFELADPLFVDAYRVNRETGSFILIDPDTNNTVAAGMIRGAAQHVPPVGRVTAMERPVSPGVVWDDLYIPREEREQRQGHQAAVIWMTGLSGSGKSTIARALEKRLFEQGVRTMSIDGDHVRHGLCGDLSFSEADRTENIRRVSETARLFFEQGSITICALVSPYRQDRAYPRHIIPEGDFFEVHVDCDLEICKDRDPKGLYRKALDDEILDFTGISAPYEPPENPELLLQTHVLSVEECVDRIVAMLVTQGIIQDIS